MKLNISDWESFCASDIFFLYNGSGITKEEIEDNPGSFPAVQSGADNNGCIGYISKDYCKAMNYTYVEEPCLTVARTGSAGFVAFQPYGCVVGDSAKILLLKNTEHRKPAVYLFLRTILMANQYKYTYGRKVTEDKYLSETLLLPSVDSITPDWASMEKYILSLHHKPLKTAITEQTPSELNTKTWHEFFLHRILICSMGNGIDAVITTSDEPKYNYVSRDSNGNGVVGFVDEIEGEEPFPAGAMSFAEHLENFLAKITTIHIQTFLTTHSAHIANTMDFSKIRYAQKSKSGVVYKNLDVFAKENADNMDFIKKYLTLSRCDLFFADKIIFVEGASERLMLPDMIEKCEKEKLFDSEKYKLPAQYYALIEIGGAYAYKFIPFADFLGLPCLILTDIDSMIDGRTKAVVSKGKTTSNATIKWWMRKIKGIPQNSKDMISLADINSATDAEKTLGKCHIEYQTLENGICGRSLEEAVMNVNRNHYGLVDPVAEEDLDFTEKSKTDFALNLICNNPNYSIPQYIKNGLIWLNKQRVLE